jgi:hypothetical protein
LTGRSRADEKITRPAIVERRAAEAKAAVDRAQAAQAKRQELLEQKGIGKIQKRKDGTYYYQPRIKGKMGKAVTISASLAEKLMK